MRFVDEFRSKDAVAGLAREIARIAAKIDRPVKLMEVCGTHTMSIHRHGLKSLLPPTIKLVSGPGCPVCVTPTDYVDRAIKTGGMPNVIIATFGDMMRVPGSAGNTLAKLRASGSDVRHVYSPADAVEIARENQAKETVFLGVGFETTAPTVASAILIAEREGLRNFSVLASHRVMPPPMRALTSGEVGLSGYICPAHVSAIIGADAYDFIARDAKIPCVVAGFEPVDVMHAIMMLMAQIADGRAEVEIQYSRAVKRAGNAKALEIMDRVFIPIDAEWRGIGMIPGSGLGIAPAYSAFDAALKFPVSVPESKENKACRCGEILKGMADPRDCPIFGTVCTPENPVGACMVSSEGSCAAEYRYSGVAGKTAENPE